MSRSRKTLEPEERATREQAEALVAEIARTAAEIQTLEGDMNRRIQSVKSAFEQLFELRKERIKGKTKLLKAWAEANPQEFGKSKSLKFVHGTIGWRKTTPKVSVLKGRTVDAVVKFLQGVKRSWIRAKPELDKDRVLADFASGKVKAEDLAGYGLKVTQQNRFFVDARLEEVEL